MTTPDSDPGDENDTHSPVPERILTPPERCIKVLQEIIYGEGLRGSTTWVEARRALAEVGITGAKT